MVLRGRGRRLEDATKADLEEEEDIPSPMTKFTAPSSLNNPSR